MPCYVDGFATAPIKCRIIIDGASNIERIICKKILKEISLEIITIQRTIFCQDRQYRNTQFSTPLF
ncbi:hypothetical protein A7D01_19460 [Xanthomonas arboricola]|nr:hypothetical protein A7D01_19460 [Xanthomonas arboricola]